MICPIPSCARGITVSQIEDATHGNALWEKFLHFRMNLWQPDGDDVMVDCPIPGCEARFLAPREMACVQCPSCDSEFCLQCRKGRHDGKTCDEFSQMFGTSNDADHSFERLM